MPSPMPDSLWGSAAEVLLLVAIPALLYYLCEALVALYKWQKSKGNQMTTNKTSRSTAYQMFLGKFTFSPQPKKASPVAIPTKAQPRWGQLNFVLLFAGVGLASLVTCNNAYGYSTHTVDDNSPCFRFMDVFVIGEPLAKYITLAASFLVSQTLWVTNIIPKDSNFDNTAMKHARELILIFTYWDTFMALGCSLDPVGWTINWRGLLVEYGSIGWLIGFVILLYTFHTMSLHSLQRSRVLRFALTFCMITRLVHTGGLLHAMKYEIKRSCQPSEEGSQDIPTPGVLGIAPSLCKYVLGLISENAQWICDVGKK